jgi:hypothetical protein
MKPPIGGLLDFCLEVADVENRIFAADTKKFKAYSVGGNETPAHSNKNETTPVNRQYYSSHIPGLKTWRAFVK